jgi:hypothetical protein
LPEGSGLGHLHADEVIGLFAAAGTGKALYPSIRHSNAAVFIWRRIRNHRHGDQRPAGAVHGVDRRQVDIRERVAVDDEKTVLATVGQQRQGMPRASRRAEQRLFP